MSLGFRKSFGSTPSGTISGGAVAQIIGVGIVDVHLTGGKPDYSFFRSKIKVHNNFASDVLSESFMGNVNWGHEVSLTVNKTPDLLTNVFAVIDRPGITARRDNGSSGYQGGSGSSRPTTTSSRYKCSARAAKKRSSDLRPKARRFAVARTSSAGRWRTPATHNSKKRRQAPVQEYEYEEDESGFDINEAFWDEEDEYEPDDLNLNEFGDAANDPTIPSAYCHWVNHLGHACIARTGVALAGIMGQMLTGRFINAWAELTGTCGKEHDDLIGSYDTLAELIAASANDERLYVQLPFTFTRFTGRALPLVSMRFHGCTISLALNPLNKLIKVSHPDVVVVKTSDGQPISKSDVDAHLDVHAVFLDLEERKRFARGQFSLLWEQLQVHEATYKGATIRAPLNFSHPSRCLIFMVQRKDLEEQNETFEYSAPIIGEDPVQFAKLIVNTTPRFAREGTYFRKVVPLLCFPRTLKRNRFLYAMSFGLDPTTENTNGTLNFSRSDNCTLNLELHPDMADSPVSLYVFNVSVNIVTFKRGLCNIEFA